ncbi:Panacea domain-containing protein [uncultured Novosphingobium sp.]|uniref:Panacea domain-containing protein n=1 Tax=uncultured Novosphingobium sp. TaxID=292277 RepID=UPI0037478E4B
MNAISAAATLVDLSGGTLTNLQIQKILYLAQMFHLGEAGEPIFSDDFQAWKLGPVVPAVYGKAKIYGNKPVTSFFVSARLPEGSGKAVLERAYKELPKSPSRLVAITHWDGGAWAKHYNDGFGSTIPKDDILAEYRAREAEQAARQA